MATYYISFDTKEMAPSILAVKVVLTRELIRDMAKPLPINLRDSPLYKELETYVLANPSTRSPAKVPKG